MTEQQRPNGPADDLRAVAVRVALRTGLLKKCPLHGEVYDPGQHDYQGALMVAAYLVNQSDPLVAPFGGDRLPLAALLKSICLTHAGGCAGCSGPAANGG
jgi:hypothetical protein